jgi:hypothetical protein
MNDEHDVDTAANGRDDGAAGRTRRRLWAVGLLAAGALGGGIAAAVLPAAASSTAAPVTAAATDSPYGQAGGQRAGGRPGETVLTGSDAEKATAAALKAVPGATVDRVETDADGAVYEAHLTKSDGTRVTVKFDKDFNVIATEAGMGTTKDAPNGSGATK